ncbi:MAG: hypothetical protein B6229_02690 [Spirochaetaceae bacterium 4572_7]|nr:MAG: hypothetical protein B6229_02690 [Spirochaetaceae bacterium 4572_7]
MKIPLKAKVICKDGEYGIIKELLIDPIKEKVTHAVLENKHNGLQVIVSINEIDYTTDSVITLEKSAVELDKYPPFLKIEYIKVPNINPNISYWGADATMGHSYTMFPYVVHDGTTSVEVTNEEIPDGEFKLRKGMVVKDHTGKKLGNIDELIINESSGSITHIVMRKGHLFGAKEIAVPNIHINRYEKDFVSLYIEEKAIDALPEVIIKRKWE